MEPSANPEEKNPKIKDGLAQLKRTYETLTRPEPEDAIWLVILKILAKLVIIGLLIVLSPVLLMVLIIAFFTAF